MAELKNTAETLLYTSGKAVEECREVVPAEIVEEVERDIQELRELIDGAGDAIAIRESLQRLELSAYKIAEHMYAS